MNSTVTPTNYDTPVGVGGQINTNTGQVVSGQMAGQQAGTNSGAYGAYTPPPVSQTTDASKINQQMSGGSTASLQFPNPPTDTTSSSYATLLSHANNADLASMQDAAFAQADQTAASNKSSSGGLLASLRKITGMGGTVDSSGNVDTSGALSLQKEQQAKNLGFKSYSDLSGQLRQVNSQITALKNEADVGIPLQLQQDATGRGITAAGLAPIQAGKLRENAIKASSLASIAAILQGDITTANDAASKAVDDAFIPLKAALSYQKQQYDMNQDTLKREDSKASLLLQAQLADREASIKRQEDNAKAGQALIASMVAANRGNPGATLAASNAAKLDMTDPNYLIKLQQVIGGYQTLEDRQTLAQIALTNASANKANADAADTRNGVDAFGRVAGVDPTSPTFTLDSIRASKGGKIATGDQTKPINKAMLVVSQLDSLQGQIANIDTGPILGILRGNNPYDVKAQLLKATLQATVPNLARGVYGEVGVLTDNDIANYTKTLPNIRSPKELSDLVLSMTLKVVKNSVDSNLQVLAAEGRDVSGFEPLYSRLESKVSEIDSRIGVKGGDSSNFASTPADYEKDLAAAKAAISAGADPAAVKARMLTKYKQVDL